MAILFIVTAIFFATIIIITANNDSNSGDAVIEATPSVTGDDTAAGNVLTNDTDPDAADTKDDAEWYQEYEEYEPKVRATKKWDADVKFRKERNMKAKNSKKKGNFKPWQH